MKVDYHIHADFSADSVNTMEDIVQRAQEAGYASIAFTEHFDFGPFDLSEFGLPAWLPYWRKFDELRQRTGGDIDLLFGVEAGEYHRHHEAADTVFSFHRPELIVASIHMSPDGFNYSLPLKRPINLHDMRVYYEENLDLAEWGRFDVLGHLSIWKRYLTASPDESAVESLIDEVLRAVIRNGIVLEVNYSSLRKPYGEVLPEPRHLARYRELGGRLITLGSDSHAPQHFDDHYDRAAVTLRETGFNELFRKQGGDWKPFSNK